MRSRLSVVYGVVLILAMTFGATASAQVTTTTDSGTCNYLKPYGSEVVFFSSGDMTKEKCDQMLAENDLAVPYAWPSYCF